MEIAARAHQSRNAGLSNDCLTLWTVYFEDRVDGIAVYPLAFFDEIASTKLLFFLFALVESDILVLEQGVLTAFALVNIREFFVRVALL